MLVDVLAGESPVGRDRPVATVAIPDRSEGRDVPVSGADGAG